MRAKASLGLIRLATVLLSWTVETRTPNATACRPWPTMTWENVEGCSAARMAVPVLVELTVAEHLTVVVPTPVKQRARVAGVADVRDQAEGLVGGPGDRLAGVGRLGVGAHKRVAGHRVALGVDHRDVAQRGGGRGAALGLVQRRLAGHARVGAVAQVGAAVGGEGDRLDRATRDLQGEADGVPAGQRDRHAWPAALPAVVAL